MQYIFKFLQVMKNINYITKRNKVLIRNVGKLINQ